jgi:hypothetical protein
MKNIHILTTSKPSRLFDDGIELYLGELKDRKGHPVTSYNIYITSDEEIKEGVDQWYLDKVLNKLYNSDGAQYSSKQDVIILTTDQDLIKDGIQSIDGEFLEWFVKNPSCEEVEVNKMRYGYLSGYADAGYKIIIPKKNFYCGDKFDYDEQCLEQCDTCVDKKGVDYGYLPKEEPKKVLTEEDIFNQKDIDAVTDYISKEQQKQALIDMMKSDEELGLYDDTEINRIELVCKDCSDSLEDCTCIKSTVDFPRQEIKLEEVFNDDKKENIKKFIDEIKNPSEPNQALKDAAERLKGKELFKESNDRARKILSEIKSLPIQERYEKYSERFDNKDNEIVKGIFNPDNWGRRLVKEKPKQETLEEAALLAYPIHLIWDEEERYDCSQELREAFIEGAKWQQEQYTTEEQHVGHTIDELDKEYIKGFNEGSAYHIERMYSEEEVIAFGEFIFKNTLLTHAKGVKNLFEQFKKK